MGPPVERDRADPLAPLFGRRLSCRRAWSTWTAIRSGPLPKAVPKAMAQVIERQWGASIDQKLE